MFNQVRPVSPVRDLAPLFPPWPAPPWGAPASSSADGAPSTRQPQNTAPTSELMTIGVPKLDSPIVLPTNQLAPPWQQVFVNLWRLAQPTGVTPGTFGGITVNANGQVVSATSSGVSFDNVTLTGTAHASTPPANDNSTAIATTAFVHTFVISQGYATETFVTSQGYVTAAFVTGQGYITDAPHDNNVYGRQNGQWVIVTSTGT